MTKSTITINGRMYDAITGMPIIAAGAAVAKPHVAPRQAFSDVAPVAARTVAPPKQAHATRAPAQTVHQAPDRSHTLHRAALKKPERAPAVAPRSDAIRKFNASPVQAITAPAHPAPTAEPPIAKAAIHPAVAKTMQSQAIQPQPQLSGSDLKEQLIKERLAEVAHTPAKKHKRGSWLGRQPRLATILSSTLALLILGGYLTYITLPSISLKVAASRAGVNATMPEYKPDGYSLDGPITYSPGEVIISYKSNTNTTGYKLVQKATNWDSQAVLDNYVGKLTDNYLTFQERGITVYTFGSKAVWVNGGLLYTIDGDAALSSDQILRLATSI